METYSLSADFGNDDSNLDIGQLHDEIEAESAIITSLIGVTRDHGVDSINIEFASTISGAEKTALDAIIAAHVPGKVARTSEEINIAAGAINGKEYTLVATHPYDPVLHGNLLKVNLVCFAQNGITSYSARIFDTSSGLTLGTGTFTNNDPELLAITNLTNVPTTTTLLEVHFKNNNGSKNKKIWIYNIVFNYE